MIRESITGLTGEKLEDIVRAMGEPEYRAGQIRNWIFHSLAASFEEMTDLPAGFRKKLGEELQLYSLMLVGDMVGNDNSMKMVFKLSDGKTIESALMSYIRDRGAIQYTACVSTQAGCQIGCPFCATGQQGFERNLTSGEMIDQVLYMARSLKSPKVPKKDGDKAIVGKINNIVFMGMGEPLANFDALWRAVEILNSPDGLGLGARNMTISSSGLVPQIERLSREKLQIGLAVSLHAGNNSLRNKLVPINRKYPLEQLIPACDNYIKLTGRRLSFEYALFRGINDTMEQARQVAELIRGMNCHVNLIPANNTGNPAYKSPEQSGIDAFYQELQRFHINVTLRQRRGQDINAGCGQLRSRIQQENSRHIGTREPQKIDPGIR